MVLSGLLANRRCLECRLTAVVMGSVSAVSEARIGKVRRQEFALIELQRHPLRQISRGHGRQHSCALAGGLNQFTNQRIHGIHTRRPAASGAPTSEPNLSSRILRKYY